MCFALKIAAVVEMSLSAMVEFDDMELAPFPRQIWNVGFVLLISAIILTGSSQPPGNRLDRLRSFTRNIEFDYTGWILDALGLKIGQSALGTSTYLAPDQRHQMVGEYLNLVVEIQHDEAQLQEIYSDPNIEDPQAASQELRQKLQKLYERRSQLDPIAESVLQNQVGTVAAEMGLALGGQPIPPVLYHATPLPLALIVSPRTVIRQDYDISLIPDLTVDKRAALEDKVDKALNVSSLVVPVGGIGVYPTMVDQTSDLNWLSEVISHEWTHNYLTLRPLGMNYMSSPQLRIMNETTASISGKEIGKVVIERYYPELVPAPAPPPVQPQKPTQKPQAPVFDFRAEMRITRVTVDKLLAEKKVDEAETYMEQRRIFFWNHGYHIRKLNQAYFAFYGAYADQPGGAAGTDPVGAAVRKLRADSPNLANFVNRISWMWSFEQLQQAVSADTP